MSKPTERTEFHLLEDIEKEVADVRQTLHLGQLLWNHLVGDNGQLRHIRDVFLRLNDALAIRSLVDTKVLALCTLRAAGMDRATANTVYDECVEDAAGLEEALLADPPDPEPPLDSVFLHTWGERPPGAVRSGAAPRTRRGRPKKSDV